MLYEEYQKLSKGEQVANGMATLIRAGEAISYDEIPDRVPGQVRPFYAREGFFTSDSSNGSSRHAYIVENEFIKRPNGKLYIYILHPSVSKLGNAFASRIHIKEVVSFR